MIEDAIIKPIKEDFNRFLRTEWLEEARNYSVDRVWNLLVEGADVLTITFTLQHIRTKVIRKIDNWEKDCATASHLLEKFEVRIKDAKEQQQKRIMEEIKRQQEYIKQMGEVRYKESAYDYWATKTSGQTYRKKDLYYDEKYDKAYKWKHEIDAIYEADEFLRKNKP